jgi:divalent metal cation (Fe/Co/Zn/Cd) transporter
MPSAWYFVVSALFALIFAFIFIKRILSGLKSLEAGQSVYLILEKKLTHSKSEFEMETAFLLFLSLIISLIWPILLPIFGILVILNYAAL